MTSHGAKQHAETRACNSADVSIGFETGFRFSLGTRCGSCTQTEARCAYLAGCCDACTHEWGRLAPDIRPSCPATNSVLCRIRRNGWSVLCLDCYQITSPHRLASVAMTEHAALHGIRSVFDRRTAGVA